MSTYTKRFIHCPNCGEGDYQVEHLFTDKPTPFGPWNCNRCDHKFQGTAAPDGVITIRKVEKIAEPQVYYLLRLRDLYVVVGPYRDLPENTDFFIHSHQCPTNLMAKACELYHPTDGQDSHGAFRYIATVSADGLDDKLDRAGTVEELFKVFGTDGRDASTKWPEENHGMLPGIAAAQRVRRQKLEIDIDSRTPRTRVGSQDTKTRDSYIEDNVGVFEVLKIAGETHRCCICREFRSDATLYIIKEALNQAPNGQYTDFAIPLEWVCGDCADSAKTVWGIWKKLVDSQT